MTVTETRVQVMRKGTKSYRTITGATVVPAPAPDYVRIELPETFKPAAGDTMRTVFKVVTP